MVPLDSVDRLQNLVTSCEKVTLTLVAACGTVIVLASLMKDEQLFRPMGSINLPMLGVAAPVRAFYFLAPWLLLIFYAYALSMLRRVWVALRDAPAILPNNRILTREVTSFPNFSALVWRYWTGQEDGFQPFEKLKRDIARITRWDRAAVFALLFLAPPIAIAFVWLRYVSRHDSSGSATQLLALSLCSFLAAREWSRMEAELSRGQRWAPASQPLYLGIHKIMGRRSSARTTMLDFGTARTESGEVNNAIAKVRDLRIVAGVIGLAIILSSVTWLALTSRGCHDEVGRREKVPSGGVIHSCYALAAHLQRAHLDSLDLHQANLRRAFLAGASMQDIYGEDAHLEGAFLNDAHLEDAKLTDAYLAHALLWEADLDRANLKEAHFDSADLRGADLRNARLQGASLVGAELAGIDLRGAIVCGATLSESALQDTSTMRVFAPAAGAGLLTSPRQRDASPLRVLVASDTAPAELSARSDRTAYSQWYHAGVAMDVVRRVLAARVPSNGQGATNIKYVRGTDLVDRPALIAAVNRVDVSMGQGTQRLQLRLLSKLERMNATPVPYSTFSREYREFESQVWEKLRNHCVPVG